jgi:carbon-monoxide dehydrogenase large subunit
MAGLVPAIHVFYGYIIKTWMPATSAGMTVYKARPMDETTKLDDSHYRFIGKPIPRNEDARLVTGRGRFSADFKLDGEAYAAMVRSPHPHARIRAIDAAAAHNRSQLRVE